MSRSKRFHVVCLVFMLLASTVLWLGCGAPIDEGTSEPMEEKHRALRSLLLQASEGKGLAYFTMPREDAFDQIPTDAKNPLTAAKVKLGKLLFHETALAENPKRPEARHQYSCASCHIVPAGLQAGLLQGLGEGGLGFGQKRKRNPAYQNELVDSQPLRAPSVINGAWQTVKLWNGQLGGVDINQKTQAQWKKDTPLYFNYLGYEGQEVQAIAGQFVHRLAGDNPYKILQHPDYRKLMQQAFPQDPKLPAFQDADKKDFFQTRMTAIKVGLAIAAYVRTLLSNQAPFQRWLRGDKTAMNAQQMEGAILFFGKARCVSCHTGPALSSTGPAKFYALGLKDLDFDGMVARPKDADKKGRGGFTGQRRDEYKFKVPQLYNIHDAKFCGHGASFNTLREIIAYKNKAIPENPDVPQGQLAAEFKPLGLSEDEIDALTAFVGQALYDPNLSRYEPTALPSGHCFPNNDPASRKSCRNR